MAPRARVESRAGADDSEDDLATAALHSSTAAAKKRTTTKMPKVKTVATRRTSAGKATAKRKPAAKPRQALKDRTNLQDGNETEDVDAFDEEDEAEMSKPTAKRAKATTTRKTAKTQAASKSTDERTKKPTATKRGRPAKHIPSPERMTIPETQPDSEMMQDIEQSIEEDPDNMDITKEPTPKPAQKFYQRAPSAPVQSILQPRPSARAGSAQPTYVRSRERSGSVTGGDRRGTDPEIRRQLNEMNHKYEDLKLKYDSLQEVGKNQAEANFEKLKRASDQKAKDANELIASLKKELAELKKSTSTSSSETTTLQKQINTLTTSNEKITAERDELKSKMQVSQNEVKSLEAKLSVARQQLSNSAQEAKAHETANKKLNNSVAVSTVEGQKEAKMKENLYADLTGLIVRGVKRKDGEDEYDCIQTGRNGTLHFHLSVANDAMTPRPKTPSGLSYEDAEFAYEPLLDESRDRELLDLLPDYLTEEICFPRNHAQRFYSKVVDSMTKRIVVDEDD